MKFKVIIPARRGSKRLVRKNLMLLGEYALIEYSILYAQANFGNENIWINSDDDEIIRIGERYGVKTFFREEKFALDQTPILDVLINQIDFFKGKGIQCDAIVLLQPTNPLRPKNLLKEAIDLFVSHNLKSLATFSMLSKKFGTINKNRFFPFNYVPGQRSQDLEPFYYENGLLYITKVEDILLNKIITEDVHPMIVDHIFGTVDIDTMDDLKWAEFLLKNHNV